MKKFLVLIVALCFLCMTVACVDNTKRGESGSSNTTSSMEEASVNVSSTENSEENSGEEIESNESAYPPIVDLPPIDIGNLN